MSHLKLVRVIAPLTVLVVVLTLLVPARSALVYANPSAMLVSGPSPFASCTIGLPGTNYVNAEVEPRVAVNPTNPSNIVGVFQQDRWSTGGAHGLVPVFRTMEGRPGARPGPTSAPAREAPPPTVATTTVHPIPGSHLLPTGTFTRSAARLVPTVLPTPFW
jgi:hypothetical protein